MRPTAEPPVTARAPSWEHPTGRRRQQIAQLVAFYRAHGALGARSADAVAVSYGGPHIQVHRAAAGGAELREAKHAPIIQAAVDAALADFPRHVRQYALPVLELLPWDQQHAVRTVFVRGVSVQEHARIQHRHPRTMQDYVDKGLYSAACALWDEDGHPIIPEELR